MAKIIATTFGGVLGLAGLMAFARLGLFGMHTSPLANFIKILAGAGVVLLAQRAGPSALLISNLAAAALCLGGGLLGFVLGRPGESTLPGLPPDDTLLVIVPGAWEAGRSDHGFLVFAGVGLAIAAVVSMAESPLRLRRS